MTGAHGRDGRRSAASLARVVALAAAAFTVAVAILPFARFAYRAPALHVAVETAISVIALLVGYLVYGRLRQTRRLQDLLLVIALSTVAVASLVLTALPSAVLAREDDLTSWAPLGVRLLGTATLAAAALTPARYRVGRRRAATVATGFGALVVTLTAAAVAWGSRLPPAVDPLLLDDGSRAQLQAHPAVLAVQVVGIALYGTAAVAFARQADGRGDELLRWVAAGCVLASFARVHYLLFPSLYSEYVYTGDLLRLGFYLALLTGGGREITSYWQARAQAAVLEDRRRMARDLHDGLIQELAYIAAQSRRLAERPGDTVAVERIASAAGRAIDESRRAIATLTRHTGEPFPTVLRQATEEMAGRYDVKIVTDLDPATDVDEPMAEALLRITGEAVRNAIHHGRAGRIHVSLRAEPLELVVTDDGSGFPVDAPGGGRTGGFGLTSMRERAAGVGANLTIDSMPGEGTTVRVSWT